MHTYTEHGNAIDNLRSALHNRTLTPEDERAISTRLFDAYNIADEQGKKLLDHAWGLVTGGTLKGVWAQGE